MRERWIVFIFIIVAASAVGQAQEKSPLIRLDPRLDSLVGPDVKVEKLAGDFGMAEGPVWDRKGGYLLFSDIRANVIHKWDPKEGKLSVFMERSGTGGKEGTRGSNGLTFDRQGRLVITAMGDRQIQRVEKDGRITVLASEYEGKRLNGTNDVVYRSDGSLYFTDPTTALPERDKDPAKELPFSGVFRVKDGKLELLIKDRPNPNGLVFSPDEKYLYVCDTSDAERGHIYRYEVKRDGTLANGKLFIDERGSDAPPPGASFPDGMKVDEKGNIYSAGPGGLWIHSPDGVHIGTILTPEGATNMAFGDADGKTMYIAARTGLYRIRFKIAGIRP